MSAIADFRMTDDYMRAMARRKELIELIAAASDEIAEIDAGLTILKARPWQEEETNGGGYR